MLLLLVYHHWWNKKMSFCHFTESQNKFPPYIKSLKYIKFQDNKKVYSMCWSMIEKRQCLRGILSLFEKRYDIMRILGLLCLKVNPKWIWINICMSVKWCMHQEQSWVWKREHITPSCCCSGGVSTLHPLYHIFLFSYSTLLRL